MNHISHTIRQESLLAYYEPINQPRFGKQAMTIYRFLRYYPSSRRDIATILNIGINAVCGRVNELIKAGWIVESGKKMDKDTKMKVNILGVEKGLNRGFKS